MVIEPLSERRDAIRSCIGVRSCTSSITTCPKVRISSDSSDFPFLPCLGPSISRASSSNATSALLQRASSSDEARSRNSARYSSSCSIGVAASRNSAFEPNKSCNSCVGDKTGHMRSSAIRMSGWPRNWSFTSSTTSSSVRQVAASAENTSFSTHRLAALCERKRRRAALTIRAVSSLRKRINPVR